FPSHPRRSSRSSEPVGSHNVDDIVGDVFRGWGLHLADVSIVLDDLVGLARRQFEAWAGTR
ncbi:MAG: hypothetical protein AAF368_08175, partial [Planctomycetota bacterium]